MPGDIAAPTIAWKHFFAVIETHVVVEPAAEDSAVEVPVKDLPWKLLDAADPRWGLGLPVGDVSVKATTCEGLGFVGRREGLVALAIVSLERP
jgi:hypothetical protein